MADKIESSSTRFLVLHARIVDGDRAALNELANELWLPLCRGLRRSFPRAAADLISDASNDAILRYAARPHDFDLSRQVPLDHFLYGVAAHILRDRLRSDNRRVARETDYGKHILLACGQQTDDRTTSHAAIQELRHKLVVVCDRTELAAFLSWLDEDDTATVAVRLGLANLQPMEQRREVRRFLTRVIRRLRRHFARGARRSRF